MLNRTSVLHLHLNIAPWLFLTFVVPSMAQTSRLFQWAFANNFLSPLLPTCLGLQIVVEPLDGALANMTGTPPYSMIAYVLNGTSVTTSIGINPKNLSWTITEPVGSQLVLSVVDAFGAFGGIPPHIYTVIAGQSTQCITEPLATPEFRITTNVTGNLSTCQPWGFTIEGGDPPYTITFPAVNSPNTTTAIIPFGQNNFTFINRALPGMQLLGAVSDLTGRWAYGTAMVRTIGSPDTHCTGLVSSSGTSPIIQQRQAVSKQPHVIIVAVSLTFSLFALSIAGFLYLHKRRKQADAKFHEIAARPFGGSVKWSPISMQSINRYLISSVPSKAASKNAAATETARPVFPSPSSTSFSATAEITFMPKYKKGHESQVLEDRPFSVSDYSPFSDSSIGSSRSTYSPPNFVEFPLTSVRAPQKSNRGPRAPTGVENQGTMTSSDEAESYREFDEPALSDSGSIVLPRSSRYAAVKTGRSRVLDAKVQQVKGRLS